MNIILFTVIDSLKGNVLFCKTSFSVELSDPFFAHAKRFIVLPNVFARAFLLLILLIKNILKYLRLINPLEHTEDVSHRNNIECSKVEFFRFTRGIATENIVHHCEELLDSLIQSQIFYAFH